MRELLQMACVGGIALCGALSLFPFRFKWKWKSWNLYLPVAGITLYAIYEVLLPAEMDVGAAMSVIVPLLLFLVLNSMAKVIVLRVLLDRAGGSRRRLRHLPQRRLQLAAALLIAAGCAVWFWATKP
jgi:hypothetical protein